MNVYLLSVLIKTRRFIMAEHWNADFYRRAAARSLCEFIESSISIGNVTPDITETILRRAICMSDHPFYTRWFVKRYKLIKKNTISPMHPLKEVYLKDMGVCAQYKQMEF